jgi:hypothetical protein
MKFLAVSQNLADPSPYLEAEGARTAELQESGVFERVLLKADWTGAVVLINADDAGQARAAVDSLPLVVNGVTRFELTPVVEPPTPNLV